MSVRTDVINLNVNVNGNKAQNELNQLRKRAADVKFEMDGLKKGTQAYLDKKKELAGITDEMTRLKKQIGLTSLNQKELIRELNQMKALKASMQPFTDEWRKLDKEIKKVENRLYDVKNGVQGFSSFFSKIKDEVKQFGMLAAGYLGFQFITSQFSNIIRGAGKMSDTLADIRRVAGLTEEEVTNLNNSLKNLDTRTSVQGLREITVIAGKLGVAKEDLLGFTKAVDQLVVTLGDELGNADQITSQLGKILNVFDGRIDGDNITKLANSFVELANTGSSTGGFIADFDQRLSGIAKSANIGLGALSGMGAALEELGGRVESSATAVQKIIITIAQDIPAAAKIAGKSAKEFANTFATAPEEAIIQFAEGLSKNKSSFAEITASFKDAGEEGARVIETLSKLGQSSDYIRERIDLGKKSIQENTAITEAFRLKNETFGATLDKLGKEFNRLVASPAVTGFLQAAVVGALKFIQAIRGIPDFIKENRVALLTLLAGLVLLNKQYIISATAVIRNTAVKIIDTAVTKASAIATNLAMVAKAAYITVINLFRDRLIAAIAAQRLWNSVLALGASGLGALLAIGSALVITLGSIFSRSKKISEQQKADAEIARRAADAYTDQVLKLESLKKALTDSSTSLLNKRKAYDQILAIAPQLKDALQMDADGNIKGAEAIGTYIENLKRKAEAEAKYSLLVEKIKEKQNTFLDLREKLPQLKGLTDDQVEALVRGKAKESSSFFGTIANHYLYIATARDIVEHLNVIKTLQTDLESIDFFTNTGANEGTINTPGNNLTFPTGDDSDKKADQLEKDAAAFAEKIKQLRRELELNGMTADQAEIQRIRDKYAELLKEAVQYNFDILQINGLQDKELEQFFKKQRNRDLELLKQYRVTLQEKARIEAEERKAAEEKDEIDRKKQEQQAEKDAENSSVIKAANKRRQEEQEEETKMRREALQADINNLLNYANIYMSVMQNIADFRNAQAQRELDRERKHNDRRKADQQKLLQSKLISEAQYNIRVAQLEEEFAAKERQVAREQAKRDKALNIFQSLINTASAVTEALPNIPLSIAVGIAGALQTAFIAATPLPELGQGGWIKTGDKHSDKSRGIPVRVERGEAWMTAAAMENNKIYSVTGNTAQITSALNSRGGGVSWAGGAQVVEMPAWRTMQPATVNAALPAVLEQGGLVRRMDGSVSTGSGNVEALLKELLKAQENNTEEIKTMKKTLKAVVSIKELREEEELYNQAKKASGLGN